MKWYDNPAHPVWLIIRQLVVLVPLSILLAAGYQNGWTAANWKTLIIPLASLGAFDVLKKAISSQDKPNQTGGDE